jgi:putative sigma-54 modulation protein
MDPQIECVVRGGHNQATDALREYAFRRIPAALRCFRHRVRRVTVRLVDLNGPRRGVDTRCSVAAELVDGGSLFVEATAAWPFAAIARAAERLSATLRRQTHRQSDRRIKQAEFGTA